MKDWIQYMLLAQSVYILIIVTIICMNKRDGE